MINIYTILNLIIVIFSFTIMFLRYSNELNVLLFIFSTMIIVVQNFYYKKKNLPILMSWFYIIFFFFFQSVIGSYSFLESNFYANDKHHYFYKEPIYFYLSFMSFIVSSIIHFIYVEYKFIRIYNANLLFFSNKYKFFIYIICLFLIFYLIFYKILYHFYEGINVLYIPFLLFLSIYVYKIKKKDIGYYISLFFIAIFLIKLFGNRYVLFSYLLSFLAIVYYDWFSKTNNMIKIGKIIKYLSIFIIVFFYLLVAFFAKTHTFKESIEMLIENQNLFFWGLEHLYYRIFEIYAHLSSIFIEYVNNHNFFFGLTYIKKLYSLISGEPSTLYNANVITAKIYQGYGYAMPGVIGEGYGNFGYLAVFFVPLMIFPILFYFEIKFFKYKTPFWAIMYISGYPGMFFNASTIVHYLFFVVLALFMYIIYVIFKTILEKKNEKKYISIS